jgi:predicted ABC-type ATPase
MRVIAGPNGSGKSTVMGELDPSWIGVFVNADDLEIQLRTGTVDLEERYGLADADGCLIERLCDSMRNSGLARKADLHAVVDSIAVTSAGQRVTIDPASVNAYVAAAISDFVRRELLRAGETFTFETVMSSPDKVEFMREARDAGYRTYLYFIATEDPSINVARVQLRVAQGGHDVPEEHIRQRLANRAIAPTSSTTRVSSTAWSPKSPKARNCACPNRSCRSGLPIHRCTGSSDRTRDRRRATGVSA